jgi:hypothetical protein
MKKTKTLLFSLLVFSFHSFAQQWGNYTLYSVQNSSTTYLIDTNNTVYHTWTHATSDKTGYSSYLMPDKTLWRTVKTSTSLNGGGITGKVQKVDWNGTVLWNFTYSSSTYCMHHDICPLPNGNVLLISYDVRTAAESAAAGRTASGSVWSEKIIEVKPTGATTGDIVWEWKLWDHLVQNVDPAKSNYQTSISEHPELLNINYNSTAQDWVHMNGIDYNPMLDQIVFSSHMLNQWFVIDHSTSIAEAASHTGGFAGKGGDFLYRYGNPTSYGMTGSTVLNVTHDAHWIPEGCPDAGRLVGFNNAGISNQQSAVDQVNVPLNGYNYNLTPGQAYAPFIYDERLACNGSTSNMGNSQQLPNGNALVCMAMQGLIYEVDPNGTTIWSKTTSGTVPQAFRYSDCYVNGTNIPIPTITEANNVLTSSPADAYQWYLNGQAIPGAISQSYTPTANGIYLVKTMDNTACFKQYSTSYSYVNTADVTEINGTSLSIYPNPSLNGHFVIQSSMLESYDVVNMLGQLLIQNASSSEIDLSNQLNGIYLIRMHLTNGQTLTKRLIISK